MRASDGVSANNCRCQQDAVATTIQSVFDVQPQSASNARALMARNSLVFASSLKKVGAQRSFLLAFEPNGFLRLCFRDEVRDNAFQVRASPLFQLSVAAMSSCRVIDKSCAACNASRRSPTPTRHVSAAACQTSMSAIVSQEPVSMLT